MLDLVSGVDDPTSIRGSADSMASGSIVELGRELMVAEMFPSRKSVLFSGVLVTLLAAVLARHARATVPKVFALPCSGLLVFALGPVGVDALVQQPLSPQLPISEPRHGVLQDIC